MKLKYHLIQRVNPTSPDAPRKFYAKELKRSEINLRQLADEIADISTVSTIDTIAVIESLIQLIPKHIMQGDIVRLGEFGSYSAKISSSGVNDENEFNHNLIKGIKIHFRPGKELKKVQNDLEFVKVNDAR